MKTKPPYLIPSMDDINAFSRNGMKVVSTFSGCGGSCLGYRMAGYKVVWANEFIKAAQDSYNANKTDDCYLDCRDIRQVNPDDILLQLGMEQGEVDLFDGSPPCQAFSMAGKRDKGWNKPKSYDGSKSKQCNEQLFDEYIRLLRGLMPKVFVAENVGGLVRGTAKGYFLEILRGLKTSGYRVECRLLDAQWLGVPQVRRRTIFVGVRNDLDIEPVFPKPLSYQYTVRDALPWIIKSTEDTKGQFKVRHFSDKPHGTITCHNSNHIKITKFRKAKGYKDEEWIPTDRQPYTTVGTAPAFGCDFNNNGGKIETENHDGTIEQRKFTIAELKRRSEEHTSELQSH